ncbi:MAG: SGNH/GDSL hydrolase family protein [Clostridiales bacterium]|jgi:lysophospholipase L1-like esterase|nr:SGNH/GDSL hydrolase family protein [Clostridiales bacterium]
MINDNAVILFQGDSITDCGRDRNLYKGLGSGYPFFLSSAIGYKYPDKAYTCLNRGVSGNRVVDLYARIKEDIINLKPDMLSILMGVNDVWHEFSWNQGVERKKFERIYRMILDEVLEEIPHLVVILMEPYVLKAGEVANEWDKWNNEMAFRREIVKNISDDYKTVFVPVQEELNKLCETNSPQVWAADGIHPTDAGHMAIAHMWSRCVAQRLGTERLM